MTEFFKLTLELGAAVLIIRLAVLPAIEQRFIAYPFSFRAVIAVDLLTMLFYAVVTSPAAEYVAGRIGIRAPVPHEISELPTIIRVSLYLVVGDLAHYWLHRLMHQPFLWRIHKWHHSPMHMSWSAGARATFFDNTTVTLGYVFAWPFLGVASYKLQLALLTFAVLKNDWMHLNVRWRVGWMEWLLVTPRYHHIHHSANSQHFTTNLAPLFSIWDRLFGTYSNPDLVVGKLEFGIGEKVAPARLVMGL